MINFYEFKKKIKRSIFERKESLNASEHPVDWAWLTYALSHDGRKENPPFDEVMNTLENWALSRQAGIQERHLAPLSIYCYLTLKKENRIKVKKKINDILNRILSREITKFSPVNDPEQMFCVSLISKHIQDVHRNALKKEILKINKGGLLRKALYTAALIESEHQIEELPTLRKNETAEGIISLLWVYERYKEKYKPDLLSIWKAFENISATINFQFNEGSENLTYISNRSIALLYEAISIETRVPDPNILFDVYPFHKQIHQVSETHFKQGNYVTAVFEATKVLNELIQQKSGVMNKNESELVQTTMKKNIGNPEHLKIKFNEYLNEDSGKNEQAGLALICEGIFKAFRNPKGHKPESHPIVQINPYEAIAQLIIISYLAQRIDKADTES